MVSIMMGGGEPRKRVSRADVAKLAGVAPGTVSLVLNGRAAQVKLAAETVRRVEEAARQLHYVPNAAARALRRQASRTIGFMSTSVPPDPHVPVFADVVTSAIRQARQRGYFVLLFPSMPEELDDVVATMRDADVAGLVCHCGLIGRSVGEAMGRAGIPVVWFQQGDLPEKRPPGSSVEIDVSPGIDQLSEHLLARGYASLGVVAGSGGPAFPEGSRYHGLVERFDGNIRHVQAQGWSSEAGREAMRMLLNQGARPDAVFAANDMLASGVLHACREAGIRVPDDLAVAGFGGFPIGAELVPSLTTVDWPLSQLASRAIDMLVAAIDGDQSNPQRDVLQTKLIVREST